MFLQVACAGTIALVLGLLVTTAGYRFFMRLLPFWGFLVGFALGAGVISLLLEESFLATGIGWIAGLLLGLLLGTFSYFFYVAGVAIFAGSIGYAFGAGLMYAIFSDPALLAFLVGLAMALIFAAGTLLLNLQKLVVISLTAAGGASALLLGILLFLGRIALADLGGNPVRAVLQDSIFWTVVWFAAFGFGWIIQLTSTPDYAIRPAERRAW